MKTRELGIIIVLFLLVIFAAQNYGMAEIKFLLWKFRSSKAIIICGSFLLGVIGGALLKSRTK